MSDWTAPAFISSLVTTLSARSGITTLTNPAVRVLDYWPAIDEKITDALIVGYEAEDTNQEATIGNRTQEETVTIKCEIRVVRPGSGATVAGTARTRTANLLGEVDNQLRTDWPEVGTQTVAARISNRDLMQFPSTDSRGGPVRVCLIRFDVEYRARTASAS